MEKENKNSRAPERKKRPLGPGLSRALDSNPHPPFYQTRKTPIFSLPRSFRYPPSTFPEPFSMKNFFQRPAQDFRAALPALVPWRFIQKRPSAAPQTAQKGTGEIPKKNSGRGKKVFGGVFPTKSFTKRPPSPPAFLPEPLPKESGPMGKRPFGRGGVPRKRNQRGGAPRARPSQTGPKEKKKNSKSPPPPF